MNLIARIHARHRFLRYRWHTERREIEFLVTRKLPDGTLIDVGAHRGVYSYWMHRTFRRHQIVAFEPQAELLHYLSQLKAAFRLDRLTIVPAALSSSVGERTLRRPKHHWGAATLDPAAERFGLECFDVPVTTLDQYLAEHPHLRPVRFIKCDAEEHELEVFAGAERILREDRPELLVEWAVGDRSRREEHLSRLSQLGYTIWQLSRGGLVPCLDAVNPPPIACASGNNYVFLPNEITAAVAAA